MSAIALARAERDFHAAPIWVRGIDDRTLYEEGLVIIVHQDGHIQELPARDPDLLAGRYRVCRRAEQRRRGDRRRS